MHARQLHKASPFMTASIFHSKQLMQIRGSLVDILGTARCCILIEFQFIWLNFPSSFPSLSIMHSAYIVSPVLSIPQNVPVEDAGSSRRAESPGGLMEQEGEMEAGLLDVDLDSYQTTLEEVLTWLLSAEDTLQIQDEVSDDVEEVKEQFHTHEVGWRG